MAEFEYHVANWPRLKDAKEELERRAREGWKLVAAYKDVAGGGMLGGAVNDHGFMYRRRLGDSVS